MKKNLHIIVFIVVVLGGYFVGDDSKVGMILDLILIPSIIYLIYGISKTIKANKKNEDRENSKTN